MLRLLPVSRCNLEVSLQLQTKGVSHEVFLRESSAIDKCSFCTHLFFVLQILTLENFNSLASASFVLKSFPLEAALL